ncbi:MAG: 3-octaprenyl-4-hydroxybenzoate decarboxylase, partial [Burkholderiales bacterium]
MKYRDLREFLSQLESRGELRRVAEPVSPHLEMTALSDRVLRAEGPALWFEKPTQGDRPVLTNLFGTPQRVAWGMGADNVAALRDIGEVLARLREPEPPKGLKDAGRLFDLVRSVWQMRPSVERRPLCQEEVLEGESIDLGKWPIQH